MLWDTASKKVWIASTCSLTNRTRTQQLLSLSSRFESFALPILRLWGSSMSVLIVWKLVWKRNIYKKPTFASCHLLNMRDFFFQWDNNMVLNVKTVKWKNRVKMPHKLNLFRKLHMDNWPQCMACLAFYMYLHVTNCHVFSFQTCTTALQLSSSQTGY